MSTFEENYISEKPRPFLKRGEGLKRRFNIDPDKFRLNNLPRYKYAINTVQKQSNISLTGGNLKGCMKKGTSQTALCSTQEETSEQFTITALPNENSTDLDTMYIPLQVESKTELNIKTDKQSVALMSWADIFNPQLINPITPQEIRGSMSSSAIGKQTDEINDTLSLFELLEQKALKGDISLAMIKKTSSTKKKQDSLNVTEKENIKIVDATLKPLVADLDLNDISIYEENSQTNDSTEESADGSDGEEDNSDVNSCSDQQGKDSNDTLFEDFKKTLFGVLQERANNCITDSKDTNEPRTIKKQILFNENTENSKSEHFLYDDEDMEEKAKLIEKRLFELEREIDNFKQQNSRLLKAKEEFAIEWENFQRDSKEATDKLNDERIKFEIYMHDEQLKLDLDKQKVEQQIRMLKMQNKNKQNKNMEILREENEKLKAQLREKEIDHSSAQARLRTQICNLKKEVNNLNEKIEQLLKENKKIEFEKQNIARGNNNKILQEVTRNIALLTAKSESTNTKVNVLKEQMKNTADGKIATVASKHLKNGNDIGTKKSATATATGYRVSFESDEKSPKNDLGNDDKEASLDKSVDEPKNKVQLDEPATSKFLENEFKKEIVNEDGSREIWYPNGNLKKISADAMTIRMLYFNRDIKETYVNDGMVKYYYAATNVWHTTYLDGLEILEFPNGQTEHRYRNGLVEVHFPNKSVKIVNPADEENLEEWHFANGTNLVHKRNGDKILILPDGQKEVHTKMSRQRVYPDGTIKVIYPDGSQETRYSNGRIRLKDTDGNLLMDTTA